MGQGFRRSTADPALDVPAEREPSRGLDGFRDADGLCVLRVPFLPATGVG